MAYPIDRSHTRFPIPWTQPLNSCSDRIATIVEDNLNPFLHSCKTSLKSMNWSRILCSSLLLFTTLTAAGGQECTWDPSCNDMKAACVHPLQFMNCATSCMKEYPVDQQCLREKCAKHPQEVYCRLDCFSEHPPYIEECLSHCSYGPKQWVCKWSCFLQHPLVEPCARECEQEEISLESTLQRCIERTSCLPPTISIYETHFMTQAFAVRLSHVQNDTDQKVQIDVFPRFMDAGMFISWGHTTSLSPIRIGCESHLVPEVFQKAQEKDYKWGVAVLQSQMPGGETCEMRKSFPVAHQLFEKSEARCFFISFLPDKPHLELCLDRQNIEQVTLTVLDNLPPDLERTRRGPRSVPNCSKVEYVIAIKKYEEIHPRYQFNRDGII